MSCLRPIGRDWCILRTSGPRTLRLSQSLNAAGIEAWTPMQVVSVRRPRSKERIEREAPIMPTFVFARADRLGDLMRILRLPVSAHPGFSIFRHAGRIPVIADRDIDSLRAAEDRSKRIVLKKQRHVFSVGERVHVPEGSFTGLTGVVQGGDGKFALICFGGSLQVKIATFLLRTDPADREVALHDLPTTA